MKGDPDASAHVREIEAQYIEVGPVRSNKDWVNVAHWILPEREMSINFSIEVLHFWYQFIQEPGQDADPEFRIEIRKNGNGGRGTYGFPDPDDEEIYEFVDDHWTYETEILPEDTFEIYLNYSGYEDIRYYCDNSTYDSGIFGQQDFLYLGDMTVERNDVYVEVFDVFDSDWNEVKEYCEIRADNVLMYPDEVEILPGDRETINGIEIDTSVIHWHLDESFKNGQEIEANVKYSLDLDGDGRGVRKQRLYQVTSNEDPIAVLTIDPESAIEGEQVEFDASDSHDEEGGIDRYVLRSDLDGELHDGEEDTFVTTNLSIGNHTISLKVMDEDGAWSETVEGSVTIREEGSNEPPEIELTSPENGAVIESDRAVLEWTASDEDGDDEDLRFDIYFDVKEDPEEIISSGEVDNSLEVFDLQDGTTYYWKVKVNDGEDKTESDIWSFTVALLTDANTLPEIDLTYPINGSILETDSVQFGWKASDKDKDDLTFNLYLGFSANSTSIIAEDIEVKSYLVTDLENEKTYYWCVVVSDGTDNVSSDIRFFTIQADQDESDDDKQWFEKQAYQGGITIIIIAIVVIVAFFILQKREQYYNDQWGEEEGYEEEW